MFRVRTDLENIGLYVQEILHFLYTGNHEDESIDEHQAETNLRIYDLVEKYDCSTLKELAAHIFERLIMMSTGFTSEH